MSSILIACRTISNEVEQALGEVNSNIPVKWVESGLHNYPDDLRRKLQEEINCLTSYENILMAFGSCGNSLIGLTSPKSYIIVPKVDDCISLLLGSYKQRQDYSREMGTYFLTQGWLEYENNISKEYEHCLKRYGEQRATKILKIMLENYQRLMVIDTGAFCLKDCLKKSVSLAEKLGLEHQVKKGSLKLLKQLITGPWDDSFCIINPSEKLSLKHFGFVGTSISNAL